MMPTWLIVVLAALYVLAGMLHITCRTYRSIPKQYRAGIEWRLLNILAICTIVLAFRKWPLPWQIPVLIGSTYMVAVTLFNLQRNTWLAYDPYDSYWHKAQWVQSLAMVALLFPLAPVAIWIAVPFWVNSYNGSLNIFYRYNAGDGRGVVKQRRRWFRVGEHSESSDKFFLRFRHPESALAIFYVAGSVLWWAITPFILKLLHHA